MIAVRVDNISKIYRIGQIGTGSLAHDIERWWRTKILHQEDPYLMIDEKNDISSKSQSEFIYSLKNISFEINKGEALGIIGKNGAGKSTLLKILSRVTTPSQGKIGIRGRIASLLEVGTGFHPELTGQENIYLNGAILGMRKKEIDRKLDEIIAFSGIERYINTPVKRYSSGMYVRLAFAVAAHLDSEIMIVDEVLAVGDAEFQKKCIDKMEAVSLQEGRTILFVSHNMSSVQNLCNNSILLEQGKLIDYGKTDEVVNNYLKRKKLSSHDEAQSINLENLIVQNIGFNYNNQEDFQIKQGEKLTFNFDIQNNNNQFEDLVFNVEIKTNEGIPVSSFGNEFQHYSLNIEGQSKKRVFVDLGECNWKSGAYLVNIYFQLGKQLIKSKVYKENYQSINVLPYAIANPNWNKYIDKYQHGYIPIVFSNVRSEEI